ncbi:uncharacterized protein BX664DRAFT_322188 [Halteromyces radiatus]|uniref:uncharacterized protein n=1 Tax=Halteromyces radiatus TaxID=101107 RepID=UPI002220E2E2|nr:uncharacterized protein BX664DRAFT_322188 [Halteromyces radiatus]KAI8099815.1 hypothetical protein BX664DRAFT_322188 [Halteromyces radiatus]
MSSIVEDQSVYRRRIILCLDGTWEDPTKSTNVFRWYEHVHMSPHIFKGDQWIQIPGYFQGVGFTNGGQEDPISAVTGEGIDQQILDAYQFLSNTLHDDKKDEVYVIGYSRGAYAARSLVGMLYNVGLLPSNQMTPKKLKMAYEFYRHRSSETTPESAKAVAFRKKYHCMQPIIRFLGCFDTVGSLGIPKLPFYLGGSLLQQFFYDRYRFHDTNISPWVQSAFHAISIHEQRQWFKPVLMKYAAKPYCEQELVQMWFPGVHSDVGGGTFCNNHSSDHDDDDDNEEEEGSCLLANQSLNWMMTMGEERGMVFTKPISEICRGGQFVMEDSYKSSIIYRLLARKDRVIDPKIFGPKGLHALYLDGNFTYLTDEELASYPSRTLYNYIDYLTAHPEIVEHSIGV